MSEQLVWVDCEMTGLDAVNDLLVEIACVVTDGELNILDEPFSMVIQAPADRLAAMDEVVTAMHTTSGLLPEIANGVSLQEAEDALYGYLTRLVPDPRKAPLAGSTVYVDRMFIARDLPRIDAHLHYRLVDVSSIKELVRRWYPRVYFQAPAKSGNHRALGDILDSINELKYYRSAIFAAAPGPDTGQAKAFAAAVLAAETAR